jgi:hypothetical protein
LHPTDLGETKDFDNLTFNKEKNSYEYDVKGEDTTYDHPLPYDTVATGAIDDNSTYDEANPYVGDEYENTQARPQINEMGMRIDEKGTSVLLSKEDALLARTSEDDRDDLDEEGYPKNDAPNAS